MVDNKVSVHTRLHEREWRACCRRLTLHDVQVRRVAHLRVASKLVGPADRRRRIISLIFRRCKGSAQKVRVSAKLASTASGVPCQNLRLQR